jgi:16S rRNA (uracil1498-N3)-methyltransferase
VTAHHLFAPDVSAETVEITGDDAHHAVRVLRLRAGERITVSDGSGIVAQAVVVEAGSTLVARIEARRTVERPAPYLTVVQGMTKGQKFDEIVQRLTEIGVDEIVPLRAARSVARWDSRAKLERLRAVARSAAKQSHRAWLPVVAEPVDVSQVPQADLTLVLHEEATTPLREALPRVMPDRITIVVGPEGGLAPREVSALVSAGGAAVSLGEQILRTETAPIVAGTLVLGRFGRLG